MKDVSYKVVLSDIDGTLLNSERTLSRRTITCLRALEERAVPFVLVSARMPRAMRPFQVMCGINRPIVCYNGAYIESEIQPDGSVNVLNDTPINLCKATEILGVLKEYPVHVSLYYRDQWWASEDDYWAQREINNTRAQPVFISVQQMVEAMASKEHGAHKIMVMGEEFVIEKLYSLLRDAYRDCVDIYRSKETYLEINSREASKSRAMHLVCSYFGLTAAQAVAFGDNYNDVEMIAQAGFGVAVENAKTELKCVAKGFTVKNIEDGVAFSLKRIFNIGNNL